MKLNELPRPRGRKPRKTKRLGRGEASGQGKTAGKGNKGQNARSGGGVRPGFEGGQMPTTRRLPKRGFTNIFRKQYAIVNLDDLSTWETGKEVTLDNVTAEGLIKKRYDGLKVLGRGELASPLVFKVDAISAEARRKVEAAGGRVEVQRARNRLDRSEREGLGGMGPTPKRKRGGAAITPRMTDG